MRRIAELVRGRSRDLVVLMGLDVHAVAGARRAAVAIGCQVVRRLETALFRRL